MVPIELQGFEVTRLRQVRAAFLNVDVSKVANRMRQSEWLVDCTE